MNINAKVALMEWWIRQQGHNRSDLYVLRLDQGGNVVGKELRNPLVNPLFGKGQWQLINDKTKNYIDWGYLWFDFQSITPLELICGSRNLTIFTSRLTVGRIIGKWAFLYIAVGPSGFFGNFTTPIWTSWRT